jgi:hypothetical protein
MSSPNLLLARLPWHRATDDRAGYLEGRIFSNCRNLPTGSAFRP